MNTDSPSSNADAAGSGGTPLQRHRRDGDGTSNAAGDALAVALADARSFWRPDLTESQIHAFERILKTAGAQFAASLGRHLAALKAILQIEQLLVMQSVNDRLGIRSPYFDNLELMRWGEISFDELSDTIDRLWMTAGRPPTSRMLGPRQSAGARTSGAQERGRGARATGRLDARATGRSDARFHTAAGGGTPPACAGGTPALRASGTPALRASAQGASKPVAESRDLHEMLTTLHGAWRNEYVNWVSSGEQGLPPLPHPVLREAIRIWAEDTPEAAEEDKFIRVLEARHQGGPTQATRV